jgi:hypothetical protein
VDVVPLNGRCGSSDGYEVGAEKSTAWLAKRPQRFTYKGFYAPLTLKDVALDRVSPLGIVQRRQPDYLISTQYRSM